MIIFEKMTETDFNSYLEQLIMDSSRDLAEIKKISLGKATKQVKKQVKDLLPKGYKTPKNFFNFILLKSSNRRIGNIWYFHEPEQMFIFLADIEIFEDFRGKGFGSKTLIMLENEAKDTGLKAVTLHVFKNNHGAKKLYEKLGYETIQEIDTGFNMVKRL